MRDLETYKGTISLTECDTWRETQYLMQKLMGILGFTSRSNNMKLNLKLAIEKAMKIKRKEHIAIKTPKKDKDQRK